MHWCIGALVHHSSLAYLVVLVRVLAQRAAHRVGQRVEGAEAIEVVDLIAPHNMSGLTLALAVALAVALGLGLGLGLALALALALTPTLSSL